MSLGERILSILSEKNMTQAELARRLNITRSSLSKYISGDREPKSSMIANIATALGTTADYLLGIETENEFNHPRIKRMIARNADNMTLEEKRELMNALLGTGDIN